MRVILLAFFLQVVALTVVNAQIVIKHDLQNQKTSYFKVDSHDTIALKKNKVKSIDRLTLEIENFNPFYYSARVTPVVQESTDIGSTNVFNPFSILAKSLGNAFSSIPDLNLPIISSRGTGGSPLDIYISRVSQFEKTYEHYQQMMELRNTIVMVETQLNEIKYDITRSGEEIKESAQSLIQNQLNTTDLNLEDAVKLGSKFQHELNRVTDSALEVGSMLTTPPADVPTVNGISSQSIASSAQAGVSQLSKTKQQLNNGEALYTDELLKISWLYKEIVNAKFKFVYSMDNASDVSSLKLKVYPKTDSISQDTIVRYFPVAHHKTILLRNSVGLAFGFFGNNGRTYFVSKDSLIGSEKGNVFVPVLSTFIHFFPTGTGSVKWGGTFGFGIPISEEANKNINFLLGVNLIFGSNEPIFITLGADGAKTNRLSQGYSVGSKTTEMNIDKLVHSYYNLGMFLSVSFNLSNLNLKK